MEVSCHCLIKQSQSGTVVSTMDVCSGVVVKFQIFSEGRVIGNVGRTACLNGPRATSPHSQPRFLTTTQLTPSPSPPAPAALFSFIKEICGLSPSFTLSRPLFAMRSFATILVTFSLPLCAFASHLGSHPRRHSDLALRSLERRDRFTYYDISVGEYVRTV